VSAGDEKYVVTGDPKSSPADRTRHPLTELVTREAGGSGHVMRCAEPSSQRTTVTGSVHR
jgi:hypothetical protein